MMNLNKIKSFLLEAKNISLGYNEINFINPDDLDNAQIGYRIDSTGNNLISNDEGGWQEGWMLIANDDLGDPIIVDTDSLNLTIISCAHGEGSWDPQVIAVSLDEFKYILGLLENVSFEEVDSADENLLSEHEKQELLLKIEQQNPDIAIGYWENFVGLEND